MHPACRDAYSDWPRTTASTNPQVWKTGWSPARPRRHQHHSPGADEWQARVRLVSSWSPNVARSPSAIPIARCLVALGPGIAAEKLWCRLDDGVQECFLFEKTAP